MFFSSRQLYLLAELLSYSLLANIVSFRLSRKTYLGWNLQGSRELKNVPQPTNKQKQEK
jgi:hypothetical protein